MGGNIVVNLVYDKQRMIILVLLFIMLFLISVVMPNYVLRSTSSYIWSTDDKNISICCVNDTYTCLNIMSFINKSIEEMRIYSPINIVMYRDFKSYLINRKTRCNLIIGLNEFEYIIVKNKRRVTRIDYLTTYRFLEKIPHSDLLLRSLISAIPYCYTLRPLNTINYVNLTKILSEKLKNNSLPVKIYRLIVVAYSNNVIEKILEQLLKNNMQLYGRKKYCNSIFYEENATTLNDILSFYDIQHIIQLLGDKY